MLHDEDDGHASHQDLPHHYAAQPYLVSSPGIDGTAEAAFARDQPLTTANTPRPLTVVGMTAADKVARKSGSLPLLRPVNIIQHDDAGPSEWPASISEHETIELPPAYGNIRSGQRLPGTVSAPTTATIPAPTEMTTS